MSSTGRKRKQQLRPRQDVHRSPVKRQSLDTKTEPLLASSYPLADYDCVDIKPDLTELQLQLAVNKQKEGGTGITSATTNQDDIKCELELELQQSDSDEDGYSEINITPREVFCEGEFSSICYLSTIPFNNLLPLLQTKMMNTMPSGLCTRHHPASSLNSTRPPSRQA